ncbi:hypothetical protein [Spiroplasma turonicum]|uniref:Uncharacterized protein n=1 Tax=Spiroplasma turonicum TaxID=216946 RepID=A0A0K1P6X8_9MOLU|nr:hypothetical protein [Spiroplasma turonicum]AKU79637.1 hypothetical protein STURON_00391 [Spiroplasma turonicum]ALX70658.1 hypothetical protein STURO_v1c03900 [Spiroplasma turonicum]
MANLIKCNLIINIKSKLYLIFLILIILTNLVSYSLLLFIGKDEEVSRKINSLQITFYFELINIIFITILTIIINNKIFYSSLRNGETNMEIISGYSKNKIWFSKYLSSKIFIIVPILIEWILVNILLSFYDVEYQPYLISQKVFFWIFLIFITFILDLVYQIALCFIKQESFITILVFLTALLFCVLLILNLLTKKDDISGIGKVKMNTAYRKINVVLDNFNNLSNKTNVSETQKSILDLKTEIYIKNNFGNYTKLNATDFSDNFIADNADNNLIKLVLDDLEIIKNNKNEFNMNFNELNNLNWREVVIKNVNILETLYKVTNDNFYKLLLDNYNIRFDYENISRSNQSFIYSIKDYSFDKEVQNYNTIKNNPEIAILINMYLCIFEEFYNINDELNYNDDIYEIYIQQNDVNEAYFSEARFNFLNQLSVMLYGYKDERFDYVIANQSFGPKSNLKYDRQVNDIESLKRYRKNNYSVEYNLFTNMNSNYKIRSSIFNDKEWYKKVNLDELIKVSNAMILNKNPLTPLNSKKWDLYFDIEPLNKEPEASPPSWCKTEVVKSIKDVYNNSRYFGCSIKNAYISNYTSGENYPTPSSSDLLLFSKDKKTGFMANESLIDNNYNIDIFSDNYFSQNNKGFILNYYSLMIPWLLISILLDVNTFFIFKYRFEHMW